MMRRLALATLFLLAYYARPAAAQTCSLSFVPLNFGTYVGTLLTGVNSATVTCPFGQPYTIGRNAGTGVGATTTIRKMSGPAGATLNYQLFQNSARTINWGNTTGVDTLSGTGTGSAQTTYVYSQVTAEAFAAPGTLTGTISPATAWFRASQVGLAPWTVLVAHPAFAP